MRNAHPRYMCFPSVVPVGKSSKVAITPRDISRVFRPDKEYKLFILGLGEDQLDYHAPLTNCHPYTVENGCLCFTYDFQREQEYTIRFTDNLGKENRIAMYAVEEDLYALRPLKGDFHTHSYYSDGADGIAMTPADYREEGYDFFALTDHNRMYPSQLAPQLYDGIPLGMHILTGEEVHTPGSMLHIVHVGGKESVCSQYIHHRAEFEAAVDAIEETLAHVPQQYRRRTAMATWACRQIHAAGGMAIFAHPFWYPRQYNVTAEFNDILFGAKIFDALEVLGGIGDKYNNLQVALWQEQTLKGNPLPVVGTTDSHNHDFSTTRFGRRFTIVFARENTTPAILEAVRSGYSVAGELPMNSESEVRFYGSQVRLVAFAHFLFENYFNETWRLCVGEGILMRRYAEGEDVAQVLGALAPTVENFYKRFYGITPSAGIPQPRLAYLDKCLEMQKTVGPETKGSNLYIYGGNERRE